MTPTRQDAFDRSTRGIIKQGGPAVQATHGEDSSLPDLMCAYRTREGRKCAIGQLLSDAEYKPDTMGLYGARRVAVIAWGIEPNDHETLDFFHELQRTHDNAAIRTVPARDLNDSHKDIKTLRTLREFWVQWRANLHLFALKYKLNEDVLKEIPIGLSA